MNIINMDSSLSQTCTNWSLERWNEHYELIPVYTFIYYLYINVNPLSSTDSHCWQLLQYRPVEMWWHTLRKHISSFARNGRGAPIQSTTGSRGACYSGSNAGYTMFRGSVKSTGYPLHSPVHLNLPVGVSSVDYWQPRCGASAVVMLDTPCSEVVWRVLATHSIRQFPLHFPTRASPCDITFQLASTMLSALCVNSMFISW